MTAGINRRELIKAHAAALAAASAGIALPASAQPVAAGALAALTGATPFLMAAKSDDVPLMRVLLDNGANPALTTERIRLAPSSASMSTTSQAEP